MSILPDETTRTKKPRDAERPFPWRCRRCGNLSVVITTIEYTVETRHDGRLFPLTIPELQIPICGECGEKVFTEEVEQQINDALRLHLGLRH